MNPTVAVCITTHNRRAELERTLGMLAKCNPPPDEILAAADGCTDGTVEWLRESHPRVQLLAHSQAMGSIPSRNELATAWWRSTGSPLLYSDDKPANYSYSDASAKGEFTIRGLGVDQCVTAETGAWIWQGLYTVTAGAPYPDVLPAT